ncbi:MAG: CotH kinase family protein [Sodaliphilus sp.]
MKIYNWIKCTAVATMMLLSTDAIAAPVRIATTPKGDTNLDGRINATDITTLVDSTLMGNFAYWCDANFDGKLNTSDITSVVNTILSGDEPASPSYSGTLPTVFVNVENNWSVLSKEEYLNASIFILYPDGTMLASPEAPTPVSIRGRGNATWTEVPKKPYKLKFPEKIALCGMKKSKQFTLLPHFLDWWGYLQNTIGFKLSETLEMDYTPKQEPVEVVMNGSYIGLYFLTEQIKVEKNRVNITEQEDEETDPELITGGWLLEIENYPDSTSIFIHENDNREKQNLYFTSHSPEIMSTEQREYITRFLQNTDSVIYNDSINGHEWEKYIDMESLAKFYIINEVLDNKEAFSGSCWMTKERGDSTKLVFGPVWDFGSSFINWLPDTDTCFHSYIYQNLPHYASTHWIERICQYPAFQKEVKRLWNDFYDEHFESIIEYANEFVLSIVEAGNCDFLRWPTGSSNNLVLRKDRFFIPSIKAKTNWLNTQWSKSNDEEDND